MEYTELSSDDQYRMLEARLKQYEQRHFDATLNVAAAEATGKTREAETLAAQVAEFEVVAGLVRERLKSMDPPAEPERPARNTPQTPHAVRL